MKTAPRGDEFVKRGRDEEAAAHDLDGAPRGACSTPTLGHRHNRLTVPDDGTLYVGEAADGLERGPLASARGSGTVVGAAGREIAATARRCISPPRLDGGTTWAYDLPLNWREAPCAEAALLLAEAARRRSQGAAARDAACGGRRISLPSWWGPITADFRVSGERRQRLTLHVHDVAHVVVDTEKSPREGFGGRITVQFKAPLLWSASRSEVVSRMTMWLWLISRWVCGEVEGADKRLRNWHCIHVELAADFTGIAWSRADAEALVIPRAMMLAREYSTTTAGKTQCNSVSFGSRGGTTSLALYDKTEEIRASKGGDASTYAPTWVLHGWMEHERVARVEFRLSSHGLQWVSDDGEVLALRAMGDMAPENLDRVFALLVKRMRIAVPNSASQRKRWRTDARWHVVRGATSVVDVKPAKQLREVQAGMHRRAVHRAALDVWRASVRLASLHGVAPRSEDAMLRIAAEAHAHIDSDVRAALLEEAAMAGYARRRAFIGQEMDAARERWRELKPRDWWAELDVILVAP